MHRSRKSRFIILAVFLCFCSSSKMRAGDSVSTGIVVYRIRSCDYFAVETPSGYAILEWYSGRDPDKDDKLVGNFSAYGFKTFISGDESNEETTRAYVEDYKLSKSDAQEKLISNCS